jgi:putative ABC transport system permease protein
MSWWSRLVNVARTDRLGRDLEDEQRFHLEARADDLIAEGLSPAAAEAEAARRFGHALHFREASRDARLLSWLESLVRDLRMGLRLLRQDATVSMAAVLSLGLAIGACTAAFALIDALLLRELPVREPDRLVYLSRTGGEGDARFTSLVSYPLFDRLRRAGLPMETFALSPQSLRQALLPDAGGVEERVGAQYISGNALSTLGVVPALGRLLGPADDVTPGAHQVAVISHAFWTRRLGADSRAVGSWLQVEQRPYQIVGIAQPGFTGTEPGTLTDIWLPAVMFQGGDLRSPTWHWLQVWGRLAPGARPESAQPIVRTVLANFLAEQPGPGKGFKAPKGKQAAEAAFTVANAATGFSGVRQQFAGPLLALAAIVSAVLLIACSNVANLLLARGAARMREMGLRASIGAGRSRLLQQVLIESSVLTLAATVVGVLCAIAAGPLLVGMLATNENPVYLDTRLDWRVLGFVAAIGCATTMVFGLAPALRAAGAQPSDAGVAGDRRSTAHAGVARPMVAAQVAFSLMLLFVAVLLLRSFDRLQAVDLGFTPDRIVLLSIESRGRLQPAEAAGVSQRLVERVRALPGVEAASFSSWALFRGWMWGGDVGLPGGARAGTLRLAISSQFFRTMGTPLLAGREFEARDTDATRPQPVIVNATFAGKYFPGESAVGQRLVTLGHGQTVPMEIIGVAADARDRSVRDPVDPFLFSPIADAGGTLQVRTSAGLVTLADELRRALPDVHPSLRLVDVTRQSSLVGNTLLRERLLAVLSGFFAGLGLALAAIGLYGVSAYAVLRRTREIGIRLTLGARPAAIVRAVLGRVGRAVAVGIVVGLAGGLYFAGFVRTLLYEVEPLSVSSLALPVCGLIGVAVMAAWVPARRALRVDPTVCLRME